MGLVKQTSNNYRTTARLFNCGFLLSLVSKMKKLKKDIEMYESMESHGDPAYLMRLKNYYNALRDFYEYGYLSPKIAEFDPGDGFMYFAVDAANILKEIMRGAPPLDVIGLKERIKLPEHRIVDLVKYRAKYEKKLDEIDGNDEGVEEYLPYEIDV